YCERTGIAGRTITVKVKYADFQITTRRHTHAAPITSKVIASGVCLELVRSVFPLAKPVRLLGVTLSNFDSADDGTSPQMTLDL
ncbi:MAG TPA: DNA polymerase IV, partial [Vineibacter sp.]|nr:DNA polymerase IV [Vineibacter sp.]